MNRPNSSNESNNEHEQVLFDTLKSIYRQGSNEMPDSDVDKQIIAAAQRELGCPRVKASYEIPWWRRLSLPLYAAAAFTFTAIGAHWYWPKPARVPPGTAPSPVVIDVVKAESIELKEAKLNRKKYKLPEKQSPDATLESSYRNQQEVVEQLKVKTVPKQSENFEIKSDEPQLVLVTDSHAQLKKDNEEGKNSNIPEKELWVKEIISLFIKGDYEAAQQALIVFKKTYPDYPIDEQIEAFRR